MSVRGVLVDADVRDDEQPRDLIFEVPDGPLDDAVRVVPRSSAFVFSVRDPEQDDAAAKAGVASLSPRRQARLGYPLPFR